MGKTQESGPERRRFAEGGRLCLPETRLFTHPPQPRFTKSSEDSETMTDCVRLIKRRPPAALALVRKPHQGLCLHKQIQL